MIATLESRAHGLHRLVGNTPLLAIEYRFKGTVQTVFAKCEQLNLTGSIKDRMALHILEQAYREGRLRPGDTIVEATSGNTGISFAAIGRALRHPVTIFMPDWMSRERRGWTRLRIATAGTRADSPRPFPPPAGCCRGIRPRRG